MLSTDMKVSVEPSTVINLPLAVLNRGFRFEIDVLKLLRRSSLPSRVSF
jgi:hypothetical protein